jgi:hypothetical protein
LLEQVEQVELIIQIMPVLTVLAMEQVAVVKDRLGVVVLQPVDMAVIRAHSIQLHILL